MASSLRSKGPVGSEDDSDFAPVITRSRAKGKMKAKAQPAKKKQRMALHLDDGTGAAETVMVSSGVAIAPDGDDPSDDSSDDDGDNNRDHRSSSSRGSPGARQQNAPPARRAAANPSNQHDAVNDAADGSDWCEALSPAQLRSLMKQMMRTPPTAPSPQVVMPAPQPPRHKRKKLMVSDFHGKADESVEAWLASVLKEAESQAALGVDTWVSELYHGATQHLKGKAEKWFITWSQNVTPAQQTFAYLVKKMKGKYSRKENAFRLQQRLGRRVQQPGERLSDFADNL